jgi:MoaD family protein
MRLVLTIPVGGDPGTLGFPMAIRVRLFAALRELAEAGETEAVGATVGEVADGLAARYGDRFGRIVAVSTFVVNGDRASRSSAVAEGDEVAILPPVSGG